MKEVEAKDAASSLGALLELVASGEEVSIKKEGAEVARIVPPPREADNRLVNRDEARAAAQRIRGRAKAAKLGPFDWEEWKAYRDEGRR